MKLTPVRTKFILHWGEMGTRWGVNRTVAQIHALLFLSPKPLNAEEIAGALSVARSNVSNCLRELQSWKIVKVVHVMGDRRDHYESMKDVWEMLRMILEERKRREIDPTLAVLRECTDEAKKAGPSESYSRERMSELLDLFETSSVWYQDMHRLSSGSLLKFAKMGGKVLKRLGLS